MTSALWGGFRIDDTWWQGGGGSQKLPKWRWRNMWMPPFIFRLTLGSRLMERNPLQTVATINVTKLNHMDGIAKMCKIEMVFNADFFFSDFSCALSSCSLLSTLLFSVKMTYLLIILHIYNLIHTFLYLHK